MDFTDILWQLHGHLIIAARRSAHSSNPTRCFIANSQTSALLCIVIITDFVLVAAIILAVLVDVAIIQVHLSLTWLNFSDQRLPFSIL